MQSDRTEVRRLAAERLRFAAQTLIPCAPVRDLLGAGSVADGYAVQSLNLTLRYQAGRRRVGRKIGITSAAVQKQVGVDQPDFGTLLDDMAVEDGAIVPPGRLLQPKVEAEVAFWLGATLDGRLETVQDVRASVAGMVAAIEIVDSRISGWDIQISDTVADNASSGMYVLSGQRVSLEEIEPIDVEMTMLVNDMVVSEGVGAACLGDPLAALLWLAQTAQALGEPLQAGEVVLSGALGPMVTVRPGDHVLARITGLGPVQARFSTEDTYS